MTVHRTIRIAGGDDYQAIADVMFDAVHRGRSGYSPAQRQAWIPEICSGPAWIQRLSPQTIFVAECQGRIVGWMSLAKDGYLDFAYIRPSSQGSGLFRALYQMIEATASKAGENRLWVHASLMAQPAFSAVGFVIAWEESVEIRGQSLRRFRMEKRLAVEAPSGVRGLV